MRAALLDPTCAVRSEVKARHYNSSRCRGQSSFKQARQRAIGQDSAAGLAAGAVVRLAVGIADSLHRSAADRARLAEPAVHGHAGTKRSDTFGKAVAGLGPKPLDPLV